MKKICFVLGLLVLASCKDKNVLCVDIGNNLKEWTVYDLSDTIRMSDQLGNDTSFFITAYYNGPAYNMKEYGGLMKKKAACAGEMHISAPNLFSTEISSTSSSSGNVREPNQFRFVLFVQDAVSNFNISKGGAQDTPYASDGYTSLETNYSLGTNTYDEALVYSNDTLINPYVNVYRFVYAKNKGLIEFSTRVPNRQWKISQ